MNTDLNTCVSSPATKTSTAGNTPADFNTIKQRQQATWASGDYAYIGTTLQIVGELLAEAVDLRADEQVLDVAAGNGNATLAAARRFAQVTSTDYVQHLLDKAAERTKADGLTAKFQTEDAEAMTFEDATFDVALSTFGVMFTPDQHRAARELLRVVRSGGRIGMANWTPESFIGDLFRVISAQITPPPGMLSPMLWGTEPRIVELFGSQAADIQCVRRNFIFRYRSPAHWIEVFRNYYGPLHKAFAALDDDKQKRLNDDITALLEDANIGGANTLIIPVEYLEVVVTRQ